MWDSVEVGKTFGVNLDNQQLIPPTQTAKFTDPFTGPGTLLSAPGVIGNIASPDYGFSGFFRDQARRINIAPVAHTSSNAVFASYYSAGFQGSSDESFGIDNIVVSENNPEPNVIPKPSTYALTGLALAALFLRRRPSQAAVVQSTRS